MLYRIKAAETELRASASDTAASNGTLFEGEDIGEGIETADRLWLKVDFGPLPSQKGFVLAADCQDQAGEPRRQVPRESFVHACVTTELRFNDDAAIKPWPVLADFLVARAIIETGIGNAQPIIPGSDGVGPLQVSRKEWAAFVANGGALVRHATEVDRQDPIRQIDAAAYRMHDDTAKLSKIRTPEGSNDPFVPQFLDVFFAYLTDSPEAALALRDAMVTLENRTEPVTKFLHGPLTDDQISFVHNARTRFFGSQSSPKTLNEVVTGVGDILDKALKQAFDDIKRFIPEAVPVTSVPELGGAGATFVEKAPIIMRALMADFGFKDFQAAAILGNIGQECGGFTLFQERHPISGRGGIGWCQWTADRRVNYENFCRDNQLDPQSDKANYSFMKHEMTNTSERGVVARLQATTEINAATELFMRVYERPGIPALEKRQTWAQRALSAFKGIGTLGTDAQTLQQQINAGRIIFDSATLKNELLGLNTGTKVSPKLQALVLKISQLVPVIRISSLVRSGTGSHHTEGRAVDIGNEEIAGGLLPLIATADQVVQLGIDELIFDAAILHEADRNKFNFDQGAKHNFNESTLNQHGNHIHFAVLA
ncbi:hypothetical protein CVM73_13400 [Bradyrhizobium forestalis]|uniref:Phage tail lysozyme domain-containing protein n=1 Tax=Bradyrhizobium forestalis TaxID=1419263 RepID=A0A2M8R9Z9_9BRAD|nr:phage tail tip lysozyme [Bradyrhizobium forestalis]PJG54654.1 hypothetical protein CVM73_13400 [Bradyrhizobium forestalis]